MPPLKAVAFQNLFGAIALLPFAVTEVPTLRVGDTHLFLLVGVASVIANLLTIPAWRLAPASLIAPLVYVEIIGATVLGYVVFGDIPSAMTLTGVAIIILAGLLLIENRASSLPTRAGGE